MTRGKFLLIFGLLSCSLIAPNAYAHTIDVIDDKYRIEIGWMMEPVVSQETNGIVISVSPLIPCPEIPKAIKCAESQEFQNGIEGLEKTLKLKLIYQEENITLPLSPDHNTPGKFYAFVNPTVSGFYQVNILGTIEEASVSLSMHPPKVDERSYIEFPEPSDITIQQMIDGHTALIEDVSELKNSVSNLEETNSQIDVGYVGIGVGVIGVVIAIVAMMRIRNYN